MSACVCGAVLDRVMLLVVDLPRFKALRKQAAQDLLSAPRYFDEQRQHSASNLLCSAPIASMFCSLRCVFPNEPLSNTSIHNRHLSLRSREGGRRMKKEKESGAGMSRASSFAICHCHGFTLDMFTATSSQSEKFPDCGFPFARLQSETLVVS